MEQLLIDLLGFFAKTATVVVAAVIVAFVVAGLSAQRAMRSPPSGHIEVLRMNERLQDMGRVVQEAAMTPRAARKLRKRDAQDQKRRQRSKSAGEGRRVFVLTFNGDAAASGVESLRREVSAVLGAAREEDEVVVRVESAGGMVHGYGLGASQLVRVRDRGLRLTVAVDKVAASGGYLMATVAHHILAAPFAVVGSIGVVAQIPNVHRLLKRHAVDVEVHTAGQFKRTLDVLGENTEQGREKLREELRDLHALFQEFVGVWRPNVDLATVSTGEAWYGQRALDRALVDELVTSDEYLARACEEADVFEVAWVEPKRPFDRALGHILDSVSTAAERLLHGMLNKANNKDFQ